MAITDFPHFIFKHIWFGNDFVYNIPSHLFIALQMTYSCSDVEMSAIIMRALKSPSNRTASACSRFTVLVGDVFQHVHSPLELKKMCTSWGWQMDVLLRLSDLLTLCLHASESPRCVFFCFFVGSNMLVLFLTLYTTPMIALLCLEMSKCVMTSSGKSHCSQNGWSVKSNTFSLSSSGDCFTQFRFAEEKDWEKDTFSSSQVNLYSCFESRWFVNVTYYVVHILEPHYWFNICMFFYRQFFSSQHQSIISNYFFFQTRVAYWLEQIHFEAHC